LLYADNYDLYFITETWLHNGIYAGLLYPYSEFTVLRKDRAEGRGGGVCVFVKKRLRIMNTFIRPGIDNEQTDRQTDRHTDKNSPNIQVKNVHHTYKTIKTQNNEKTYAFTYNSLFKTIIN